MNIDNFYIIILNRYWRHTHANNDFHIERVYDKNDILEILKSESTDNQFMSNNMLIVTNDKKLITTYLIAINEDELKMLCRLSEYNKREIRINKEYFNSLDKNVYKYFTKIYNSQIISANMNWSYDTMYGGYDDPTIGVETENFLGWIENKEFLYFKTPHRYSKNDISKSIFNFEDIQYANLNTLNSLMNINILEINFGATLRKPSWENKKDTLLYYDKVSCRRLFIEQNHLNQIRLNNGLIFNIDTNLDQNHYIEYYVTGIKESID